MRTVWIILIIIAVVSIISIVFFVLAVKKAKQKELEEKNKAIDIIMKKPGVDVDRNKLLEMPLSKLWALAEGKIK